MEQNNAQTFDIEKTKELFEYEMTEVILNLKGEFAVISGEQNRYRDAAVDREKLKVAAPAALPEINAEIRQTAIPATEIGEIGEIKAPERTVGEVPDIPEVPAFDVGAVAPVQLEQLASPDITVPSAAVPVKDSIRPVQTDLSAFTDIAAPAAPRFAFSLPAKPDKTRVQEAFQNAMSIEIPAMTFSAVKQVELSAKDQVSVPEVPNMSEAALGAGAEVVPAQINLNVRKPATPAVQAFGVQPPEIKVETPAVQLPSDILPPDVGTIAGVTVKKNGPLTDRITDTGALSISPIPAVKTQAVAADVPTAKAAPDKTGFSVRLDPLKISPIPDTNVRTASISTVKTQDAAVLTGIDAQISCENRIPSIPVKKVTAEVPPKPDYAPYIDEILRSVGITD